MIELYSPEQTRQVVDFSLFLPEQVQSPKDVIDRLKAALGWRRLESQVLPEGRIIRLRQRHGQVLRAAIASIPDKGLWGPEPSPGSWRQMHGQLTHGDGNDTRWRRDRTYDDTRIEIWHNMPSAYRRQDPTPGSLLVRDARDTGIEIRRPGMRCVVDVTGGLAVHEETLGVAEGGPGDGMRNRLGAAAVYGLVRDVFAEYLGVDIPK